MLSNSTVAVLLFKINWQVFWYTR